MDTRSETWPYEIACEAGPLCVRTHGPGDMGWVLHRHAVLYHREHGFDLSFDTYVLNGLQEFAEGYDPATDRLWIAESDGSPVGSIALMASGGKTAQLRWFLVEPEYRGLGVGRNLLDVALEFARSHFDRVFLWTLGHLEAARALYVSRGFTSTEVKTHGIWGRNLTEERMDWVRPQVG